MKIKSYSKINLTLRVLNKQKNNMHNIETNSTLISFCDDLTIKKSKADKIIFTGKFKNKINSKKNTAIKTLKLLRKLQIIKNFYRVIIKKNIPVFAGLGGGTSNSASIVKYFLKDKISKKLISVLEKKVGSDFRLFLNKYSFQKKLGNVFKGKNKINYPLIVVFPFINCETKAIYNMVKTFSLPTGVQYLKKIEKKKFIEMIKKDKNDLQKIVEKKYPNISLLINFINQQKGCILSRMTGSGSACYGIFKSKKTAKLATINLKRKYPKYWCVITKTI